MNINLILILLACALGIMVLVQRFKSLKEYRQKLADVQLSETFEVYDFSKKYRIIYALLVLAGIVYGIVGWLASDYLSVTCGILIAILFSTELMTCGMQYTLYYNDRCFFAGTEKVEYRSIKSFEKADHQSMAFTKVVTYSGKDFQIAKKAVKVIEEKRQELKKKKK